jgi:protein-S-isoprenylcysteine O-methyltransferase Ste14
MKLSKFAPALMFAALWLLWALYWRIHSRGAKATVWAESLPSRLMHVAPMVVAALLLALPRVPLLGLDQRFLPRSVAIFGLGWLTAGAGLSFTVWARRHLAANWSADVTLKEGHELITSGPYALVRHPIYTGLWVGVVGSALALGEWRGLLAVAVVGLSLWRKLRVEEGAMRQLFGERYQAYAQRVAALIPFVL